MRLTSTQRKRLRGLAHDLHPVVQLGKAGLSDAVVAELDRALADHELIKIRFVAGKEAKAELLAEVNERLACAEAGRVGHVAILYRPQRDPEKRRIRLDPD